MSFEFLLQHPSLESDLLLPKTRCSYRTWLHLFVSEYVIYLFPSRFISVIALCISRTPINYKPPKLFDVFKHTRNAFTPSVSVLILALIILETSSPSSHLLPCSPQPRPRPLFDYFRVRTSFAAPHLYQRDLVLLMTRCSPT